MVHLSAWRDRRSWAIAAEHLNGAGLAAAVPPELAGHLAALGYAVWPASIARERAS